MEAQIQTFCLSLFIGFSVKLQLVSFFMHELFFFICSFSIFTCAVSFASSIYFVTAAMVIRHFSVQAHMSLPNVEKFIDLLVSIPAEGHKNSFAYVMSEWTRQQGECIGLPSSHCLVQIFLYSLYVYRPRVIACCLALLMNLELGIVHDVFR